MSTHWWLSCFLEEIHRGQTEIVHCSQYHSHISVGCVSHLGFDLRNSKGTTLCCLQTSEICFPSHSLQRCMSQKTQCKEGTGISHISHRATSCRLNSGSIANHLKANRNWKKKIEDYFYHPLHRAKINVFSVTLNLQ